MTSWWPKNSLCSCIKRDTESFSLGFLRNKEFLSSLGNTKYMGNPIGAPCIYGKYWLNGSLTVYPGVLPWNCYHPGYTRILSLSLQYLIRWRKQWCSQSRSAVFLELSFKRGTNQWCFVHKNCNKAKLKKRSNLRNISSLVNILLVLLGIHILHDHGPFCADIDART